MTNNSKVVSGLFGRFTDEFMEQWWAKQDPELANRVKKPKPIKPKSRTTGEVR